MSDKNIPEDYELLVITKGMYTETKKEDNFSIKKTIWKPVDGLFHAKVVMLRVQKIIN